MNAPTKRAPLQLAALRRELETHLDATRGAIQDEFGGPDQSFSELTKDVTYERTLRAADVVIEHAVWLERRLQTLGERLRLLEPELGTGRTQAVLANENLSDVVSRHRDRCYKTVDQLNGYTRERLEVMAVHAPVSKSTTCADPADADHGRVVTSQKEVPSSLVGECVRRFDALWLWRARVYLIDVAEHTRVVADRLKKDDDAVESEPLSVRMLG